LISFTFSLPTKKLTAITKTTVVPIPAKEIANKTFSSMLVIELAQHNTWVYYNADASLYVNEGGNFLHIRESLVGSISYVPMSK